MVIGSVSHLLLVLQGGFRCGRGCRDHIFVLRHIIHKSVKYRKPLAIAFVDFEKVIDSVDRDVFFCACLMDYILKITALIGRRGEIPSRSKQC